MSAALVPTAWSAEPGSREAPAPAGGPAGSGMADAAAPVLWQRRMARNCSLSPSQALLLLGGLGGVCLAIGGFFAAIGAPWVLVFSGLEVLALAAALLVYGRHATDHETLWADGVHLQVQQQRGADLQHTTLALAGLQVTLPAGPKGLLVLRSGTQQAVVGCHVRPEQRPQLQRALQLQATQPFAARPLAGRALEE